jgi:hypothetical protein
MTDRHTSCRSCLPVHENFNPLGCSQAVHTLEAPEFVGSVTGDLLPAHTVRSVSRTYIHWMVKTGNFYIREGKT